MSEQHDPLEEEVFSFRESKEGVVLLYWYNKHIKTLAGSAARKFLARIEGQERREAQLVMAKATGNFKRGNERRN